MDNKDVGIFFCLLSQSLKNTPKTFADVLASQGHQQNLCLSVSAVANVGFVCCVSYVPIQNCCNSNNCLFKTIGIPHGEIS